MTEKEKCELGYWYDANNDTELLEQREEAEEKCFLFNQTSPKDHQKKEAILKALLPHKGEDVTILAPFYTDYGNHCTIGDHTFINHHAYLMDGAPITIGSHVFIGPNCGMYTAMHPLLAKERDLGLEKAKPIVVGDHVWIGADVTILPGVTIGDHTVIGAKSLVTKNIPDHVLAFGQPCKVIRKLSEEDQIMEKMENEKKNFK